MSLKSSENDIDSQDVVKALHSALLGIAMLEFALGMKLNRNGDSLRSIAKAIPKAKKLEAENKKNAKHAAKR